MSDATEGEDDEFTPGLVGSLGDFRAVDECARLSSLGKRFIVTLGERGEVRREQAPKGGWRYNLDDCHKYVRDHETPGLAGLPSKGGRTQYETELQTLVTGYKDLLTQANGQVKQAQQHERDLFAAFSGPLNALVLGLQAQVNSLVSRADAGDKSRLDFLTATEAMLRDGRVEALEEKRQADKSKMRETMWADLRKAAPELWAGIQETLSPASVAAKKLRASLEKEKVAALFAFDFLTSEQKDLLCQSFDYDRAELEAMAKDAGATETVGEVPDAPEANEGNNVC